MKEAKWACIRHGVKIGEIVTHGVETPWWKFWDKPRRYKVIKIDDIDSFTTIEIIPFWQFWRER